MPRTVAVTLEPGTRGRIPAGELRRIARFVLDGEAVAPHVTVDIVLAGSETVRELNRLYRGQDEPTDVLSFAAMDHAPGSKGMSSFETPAFVEPPDESPSLGEIVVCLPVAEAQAREGGREVKGEVAHLLVHGLMHLLGHDHELGEGEARLMQQREDAHLGALGYAGQYAHGHE